MQSLDLFLSCIIALKIIGRYLQSLTFLLFIILVDEELYSIFFIWGLRVLNLQQFDHEISRVRILRGRKPQLVDVGYRIFRSPRIDSVAIHH